MVDNSGQPGRLIKYTDSALLDIASIRSVTAITWGFSQAERYLAFLDSVFAMLAEFPRAGAIVSERPEFRSYVAKKGKGRGGHGHRIFYQEIEGGIRVFRVLHTAMNWQDHLNGHGG